MTPAMTAPSEVWDEVRAERLRAHLKHGDTSMESLPTDDPVRLSVLTEEVGEVARALNEARHTGTLDRAGLRAELIQVAAMAGAWADALGRCSSCDEPLDSPGCARSPEGRAGHTIYGGVGAAQNAAYSPDKSNMKEEDQ